MLPGNTISQKEKKRDACILPQILFTTTKSSIDHTKLHRTNLKLFLHIYRKQILRKYRIATSVMLFL